MQPATVFFSHYVQNQIYENMWPDFYNTNLAEINILSLWMSVSLVTFI